MWEDDVLNNNTANVVPMRQSRQRNLHYFWEPTNDNNIDSENCAASVVPMQQSCRRTLRFSWEPTDDNTDLNEGVDIDLEYSKRIKIMADSQHLPIKAESEVLNRDDTMLNETLGKKGQRDEATAFSVPPDHVGFPEFEVINNFLDLDRVDSELWDAIMEEALSLSSSSRILSRHSKFERQISSLVAGAFGGIFLLCFLFHIL